MPAPLDRIAEMHAEGIRISEEDEPGVIAYLERGESFQHLKAYWHLFPRHLEGRNKGKFIDLAFDDLVKLDELDKEVQRTFLDLALAVEKDTKMRLLASCAARGDEDGYAIVEGFMAQLPYREALEAEFDRKSDPTSPSYDIYTGGQIREHRDHMPIDVFCEVVTFGTLVSLVRFAAVRWGDDALLRRHYVLRQVKDVRNAGGHQSCIISGLSTNREARKRTSLGKDIYNALDSAGIRNTNSRGTMLNNPRMQELVCTIYAYNTRSGEETSRLSTRPGELSQHLKTAADLFAKKSRPLAARLNFLAKIIDERIGAEA